MNIAVWCGSNGNVAQAYVEAARALGAWIARAGHTLVFGGTRTGLMGALSDSCVEAGGAVHGVSVRVAGIDSDASPLVEEMEFLPTMAARKERMIALADAVIALPGGPGTLDELTDCLVLVRLGLRDFPCILFNVDGYYDDLAAYFARMRADGFANSPEMDRLHVCNTLADIARMLA